MTTKPFPIDDIINCPNHEKITRGFEFSRKLDWSHLLLTIATLAGMFVWAMSQERRVTTIENNSENTKALQKSYEDRLVSTREEMKQDLREINAKLDRLVERKR